MKSIVFTQLMFCAVAALAQSAGVGTAQIDTSFRKLFGDLKTFSVQGSLVNQAGKVSLPISLWMLDGRLRIEIRPSEKPDPLMPPQYAAMMKAAGMDVMHLLIAPEKNSLSIIYPNAKCYTTQNLVEGEKVGGKLEAAELGKESLSGHPCVKKKVSGKDAKGTVTEALVWTATDLKNFPIQVRTLPEGRSSVLVQFQTPSFEPPDAKLFELPADYVKYENIQALMKAKMK